MKVSYPIFEWGSRNYGVGEERIPARSAAKLAAVAAASIFANKTGKGVLDHGRDKLGARDIVGIISADDCVLEILPKIENLLEENKQRQNGAIRSQLVHMLSVTYNLNIDVGAVTELTWQSESLLEILIRIFSEKLTDAVRLGMPRRYKECEDDLPALRGGLNISRQFTRHAVNPSRLSCRYDVLSEDITINHVMKAAVTQLLRVSGNWDNQRRLRELSFVYADIADITPAALKWDDVLIDRTNKRWSEMLSIAKLLLQNRFQTTESGETRGMALLFEMNSLFEEYIGRLVRQALAGSPFTVSLLGGGIFCLTTPDERRIFRTKPDILIRLGSTITHVIDTKWKKISANLDDPKQGVSQADVYQMMAYGQLYKSPRLTLLYPYHTGLGKKEDIHSRNRITGFDGVLEIASVDIANRKRIVDRLRAILAGTPQDSPSYGPL